MLFWIKRLITKKVKTLLSDDKTYACLHQDPTQSYKSEVVKLLQKLKKEGAIDKTLYKKLSLSNSV